MNLLFILLVTLYSGSSYGSAYSDGDGFGKSLLNDLGSKAGNLNKSDIPHYTDNPKEAALSSDDLESVKTNKNNKAVQLVKESAKTRQKNDMKFMAEEWFKSSEKITKASEINANCKAKKSNNLGPEIAKYTVQVEGYRTIEETKYCEESVEASFPCSRELKLTCNNTKECNSGGIVADSVESDMKFEYRYPVLTIGTISDNYWGGNCSIYDRNTSFNIKNNKDITEFKIFEVGFDDYFLIRVNGHLVYVGPDGGNKLEVYEEEHTTFWGHKYKVKKVNFGPGANNCERSTSWQRSVNIDLLPFLKEGKNEIYTRTLVSGGGEGWMKIRARQHCCNDWIEEWRDNCEELRK